MSLDHERYIRRCIELAEDAARRGDEPFGALLVARDEVVLTAQNTVITDSDRTRHAELILVSDAMRELSREVLESAILYSSAEPCVMCAGAIYWSRIPRVVFGCSTATLGTIGRGSLAPSCRTIFSAGRRNVEVIGPVLEPEALAVLARFWKEQHR